MKKRFHYFNKFFSLFPLFKAILLLCVRLSFNVTFYCTFTVLGLSFTSISAASLFLRVDLGGLPLLKTGVTLYLALVLISALVTLLVLSFTSLRTAVYEKIPSLYMVEDLETAIFSRLIRVLLFIVTLLLFFFLDSEIKKGDFDPADSLSGEDGPKNDKNITCSDSQDENPPLSDSQKQPFSQTENQEKPSSPPLPQDFDMDSSSERDFPDFFSQSNEISPNQAQGEESNLQADNRGEMEQSIRRLVEESADRAAEGGEGGRHNYSASSSHVLDSPSRHLDRSHSDFGQETDLGGRPAQVEVSPEETLQEGSSQEDPTTMEGNSREEGAHGNSVEEPTERPMERGPSFHREFSFAQSENLPFQGNQEPSFHREFPFANVETLPSQQVEVDPGSQVENPVSNQREEVRNPISDRGGENSSSSSQMGESGQQPSIDSPSDSDSSDSFCDPALLRSLDSQSERSFDSGPEERSDSQREEFFNPQPEEPSNLPRDPQDDSQSEDFYSSQSVDLSSPQSEAHSGSQPGASRANRISSEDYINADVSNLPR